MDSISSTETIQHKFKELDTARAAIKTKVQEYAHYTLPWIFPQISKTTDTKNQELPQPAGSIGARCVNHLANKIITALFVPFRPFFKLNVSQEGIRAAQEELNMTKADIDVVMSNIEHKCTQDVDMAQHRTQAVMAAKQLIITGNALLKYIDSKIHVYNFHDFVLKRNLDGEVIEFILEENINTNRLPAAVNAELERKKRKPVGKDVEVQLYTRVHREYTDAEFIWKVAQAVDSIEIDISVGGMSPQYQHDDLPWIFLTWNLARGEDYGRGLIEDYSYAFHAHEVLSSAQMRMFAVMSDIKYFVEPGALPTPADLEAIVSSPAGSYHELPKSALWSLEPPVNNIAVIDAKVNTIERELAQAFLLNSAAVRDAERVTAEEIRMQVQELETSYGGIYSRLANEWQTPLAVLLLKSKEAAGVLDLPYVSISIVTGVESMSRLGELENIRTLLNDMSGIGTMPTDVLSRIKVSQLWAVMASLRGLDGSKFIKTDEEYQAEQQAAQEAAMAQQQAIVQQQAMASAAAQIAQQT